MGEAFVVTTGHPEMAPTTKSRPEFHPSDLDQKTSAPYDTKNSHTISQDDAPAYTPQAAFPPLPQHIQATTRTFNAYFLDLMGKNIRIVDADSEKELFIVKSQIRRPNMLITSSQTGDTLGTAVFHAFTCRVDTTVRGHPIAMNSVGTLGRKGYTFPSSARPGTSFRWKCQSSNLDIICYDERDVAFARFHFSNWSLRKCGKLEFIGPLANDGGPVMEEIFVTGMAMMEYVLAMRVLLAA
ncbi:MAG: hypothetical protein M1825_000685 [Sarcosagium campestre]|nr:MAG: hypothetical protein M1825_000685 [Sarcosagium campestre]